MLGNIVEIAAEGKKEGLQSYMNTDYPLTQHGSMGAVSGLLVSELWNIVTQQYCRCTLHVWTTDTFPNGMRQSALAIESS